MTATIEAPVAKWMLTWRNRVRIGTMMIPPPNPSSDPSKPAPTEVTKAITSNHSGVTSQMYRHLNLWTTVLAGPLKVPASILEKMIIRAPITERLMVRCACCGEHLACGLALSEPAFEKATLDEQTYQCPSCGSEAVYETYDHFLE